MQITLLFNQIALISAEEVEFLSETIVPFIIIEHHIDFIFKDIGNRRC